MRPRSIPEFTRMMNELFKLKNGHAYLDTCLTQITGQIELDILKLDDLLHERHGEYEQDARSMSDLMSQEYGAMANAFVTSLLEK
jgi:hypothetical protein